MIRNATNVRNSTWNLANILIYPAAFLAFTPFFIDKLGENVFGEWMLINAYVYIAVSVIGFGLPVSVTAHVAEARGRNDTGKLYAYINASSRITGRMTLLTMAAGVLFIAGYATGIHLFEQGTWKTLVIATFLISVKFPEVLYQSIFKGFESYDRSAFYNMMNRFLALGAQVFLVMNGYSLPAIFLANLAINLLVVAWQGISIYRRLPGYAPVLINPLPERKAIYHFGFWTWLQTIISIAAYQSDRFIVAYYLGTATVTYYVLASTIANHLHMAFEAVVSWLLPKISRMKAAAAETRAYFITVRALSVGFSLLVIIALYAASGPLFQAWLGPDKYGKMIGFFKLFLIFEGFFILSIVPKYYLTAIRSLTLITLLELMYKTGIVAGMVVMFAIIGSAESLIWGQIIALALFMPMEYFLVNRKVLQRGVTRETLLTSLPSLLVMAAILLSPWYLALASALLAAVAFWFIFVSDREFNWKLVKE